MSIDPTAKHITAVDADGHVLEPRDVWLRYLDPACATAPSASSATPQASRCCSSTAART